MTVAIIRTLSELRRVSPKNSGKIWKNAEETEHIRTLFGRIPSPQRHMRSFRPEFPPTRHDPNTSARRSLQLFGAARTIAT